MTEVPERCPSHAPMIDVQCRKKAGHIDGHAWHGENPITHVTIVWWPKPKKKKRAAT
jgi:hypothetical protein